MMKSYEAEENDVKGMTTWMAMMMLWMDVINSIGERCNELRIGMYKRETVEELIHNRRE